MRASWIFLVVVLCSGIARADVTPPDVEECSGKSVGSACREGKCTASTCSRIDYMNWNRDASATPPSASYECVRCLPSQGSQPDAGKEKEKDDGNCNLGGGVDASWAALLALALLRRRR